MPYPFSLQDPPQSVIPNRYVFPASLVQGDRLQFRVVNESPYTSADGWSFVLVLRIENPGDNNQGAYQVNSAIDSGDFLLNVDPGTTAQWVPARYRWELFAINGTSDRETVQAGYVDILPDLKTATGDQRSHARRTLDLIEALIEGRATNDILESTIDNTRFTRMTPAQLLAAHSYYTAIVRKEEAKARVKNGLASGRTILYRFGRPF